MNLLFKILKKRNYYFYYHKNIGEKYIFLKIVKK